MFALQSYILTSNVVHCHKIFLHYDKIGCGNKIWYFATEYWILQDAEQMNSVKFIQRKQWHAEAAASSFKPAMFWIWICYFLISETVRLCPHDVQHFLKERLSSSVWQRYANLKQAEMLDVHHCFLFSLLQFLHRSIGALWLHSTFVAATARQAHPTGSGNECTPPKGAVPNWTELYLVLSGTVAIVTWQLPVNEQSLENKMDKMALRLPTVLDKLLSKCNTLVHLEPVFESNY